MHGRIALAFFVQDEEFQSLYRTIPFPSSHGPQTHRPSRPGRPPRALGAGLVAKAILVRRPRPNTQDAGRVAVMIGGIFSDTHVMNEHIRKGNEALAESDLQTAKAEFTLALSAPDATTQRIAKNRLRELEDAPAPLRIAGWEELIIPATKSRCCGARAIFVRSREGGFIAKNCTCCKKSGLRSRTRLPAFGPLR
jgi:hypothetical protein